MENQNGLLIFDNKDRFLNVTVPGCLFKNMQIQLKSPYIHLKIEETTEIKFHLEALKHLPDFVKKSAEEVPKITASEMAKYGVEIYHQYCTYKIREPLVQLVS